MAVRDRWRATSVIATAYTEAESTENERLVAEAMAAGGNGVDDDEPGAQLHLSNRIHSKPNPDARELELGLKRKLDQREPGRFFRHSAFLFQVRVGLADL